MASLTIQIGTTLLGVDRTSLSHMRTLDDLLGELNTDSLVLDENHVDTISFVRALEYDGLRTKGTRVPVVIPPARMRCQTDWELIFFSSLDVKNGLFTLLRVASYLGYNELYDSCLLHLAYQIQGKDKEALQALLF